MRALEHPDMASVALPAVLGALSDPVRLEVVRQLYERRGCKCGEFDVPVTMSTLSHHLKVLRHAGLLRVTAEGSFRNHELRFEEMESRFPGVLASILAAARRPAQAVSVAAGPLPATGTATNTRPAQTHNELLESQLTEWSIDGT